MSATAQGTPAAVPTRDSAWTRPARRRAQLDRRRFVSALLAFFDAVFLVLVVSGTTGRARELAGIAFCVLVPGWSIVGLLRIRDAVLEFSLVMASGLAFLVVLAQLAITAGAWHLFGIEVAVCAACLASLVFQFVRPDATRRSS